MFRFFHPPPRLIATVLLAGLAAGCDGRRGAAHGAESERPDPAEVLERLNREGGVHAVVELESESAGSDFIATLEKRLAQVAGSHFLVEADGRRISVKVAGTTDTANLTALLRPTRLRLREVHGDSASLARSVFDGGEIVPGYRAYVHHGANREGTPYTEHLLLAKRAAIEGGDVEDAWPQTQGMDHQVGIKLTNAGGDKMINLTRGMTPGVSRIAILLDDEVLSAPVVQSVPLGRNFVIQGQDTFEDASELASRLLTPLEIPFTLKSLEPLPAAPR